MSPFEIDAVGLTAAVLTTLCWIPQTARILRNRDARAISLAAQSAFASGCAMWLAYGVLIGSLPIIASNVVTLILIGAIIVMKLRYG